MDLSKTCFLTLKTGLLEETGSLILSIVKKRCQFQANCPRHVDISLGGGKEEGHRAVTW